MRSPGINGEGELRGQMANPGSPGKMADKTECVCSGWLFVPVQVIDWKDLSLKRPVTMVVRTLNYTHSLTH